MGSIIDTVHRAVTESLEGQLQVELRQALEESLPENYQHVSNKHDLDSVEIEVIVNDASTLIDEAIANGRWGHSDDIKLNIAQQKAHK